MLLTIRKINWNIKCPSGYSALSEALRQNRSDNVKMLLSSVPDLEVDVDFLKSENLYEKLSDMCHEYVSDLKDEDEENILKVAVKHDLFNIFKILSTSTNTDFNAVNQ